MKIVARNISFTELHDALIDERIAAGAYQTASEVVRDAMRLLQERDELHQNRLAQVRTKIEKGWDQSERGQMVEGAAVEAHFKEALDGRSTQARMNYSLSEEAFADLDELWGYIAADSIDAADRVVASFVAAFGLLATHPLIGHGREEVTERPLLFWPVGSYTIVYRPETEPLRVIAVLHGARDFAAVLSSRG